VPAGAAPAPEGPGAASASSNLQTIGFGGTLPDLKTVEINNGHVYDYTFATAPTDWWVQSGVWEMTNRWNCSPGWSWFGGRSEEVASVWNKRRFAGDISVQFYFAFKMGLAGTTRWTYHPSDVAVTFCGDGKNLGSGYALVVGADDNQRSVLMRGGKVVAETRDNAALLPVMSDGMPPNMNDLHRRWWYVRINKIGSRVECWLDNVLILTYDDPRPLDSGQIALWTYNNGIMLSRVQIYYQDELRPGYRRIAAPLLKAAPVLTSEQRTPFTVAQR
jgi:hypothetical protein